MRRTLLLLASVTAPGALAVAVHAQAEPIAIQTIGDPYAGVIAEAAQRFAIPAAWIRAIMRIESRGDQRAASPKGAMGLMQLMPQTWTTLRARYGLGGDPFDPHDNIMAGAAFLRDMHDRYGSPGFLAAYNAGPGRYEDYRDRHRPLPSETLAYVAQILPLIGGNDGAIPIPPHGLDPLAWTRAPIFIGRSVNIASVDHGSIKRVSNETQALVGVRDLSAIAPQSDGLFVTMSVSVSELRP